MYFAFMLMLQIHVNWFQLQWWAECVWTLLCFNAKVIENFQQGKKELKEDKESGCIHRHTLMYVKIYIEPMAHLRGVVWGGATPVLYRYSRKWLSNTMDKIGRFRFLSSLTATFSTSVVAQKQYTRNVIPCELHGGNLRKPTDGWLWVQWIPTKTRMLFSDLSIMARHCARSQS